MHIPGQPGPPVPLPRTASRHGERDPALPVDTAHLGRSSRDLPSPPTPSSPATVSTASSPGVPLVVPNVPDAPGQVPAAPLSESEAWKAGLRKAERRAQLAAIFQGTPDEALCHSEDPVVARAACFVLGRSLPETNDPLAMLYQPFRPGDETAALSRNTALQQALREMAPFPGDELPDSRGEVVSMSRALVDRLVHDPDPNSERAALKFGRSFGAWDGLDRYYALIEPEKGLVGDLLAHVERAYAERGHSQNMEKVDKTRLSVLASLPLAEADSARLNALLFRERLEERNWLGDVVDARVRKPRHTELLEQLGREETMAGRLAVGRELFAMGMSMPDTDQLETVQALSRALAPLSPVALETHAKQVLAEVPPDVTGVPRNEDLVGFYELSALMRCPGVTLPAEELLHRLEPELQGFGRRRAAAGFLALSCTEHLAARLPTQSLSQQRVTAGKCLEAAYRFPLGQEMADSVLRHWRAAFRPDPEALASARNVLTHLPAPEDLDGARTAQVVEALMACEHDASLRRLAPDAVKLLYRDDKPGAQICAQYLYDELVPALLSRDAARMEVLSPKERSEVLLAGARLTAASRCDGTPLTQGLPTAWEAEMARTLGPLEELAKTHGALTASPHPADVGWHYLQASKATLESFEQIESLVDFADFLSLVGPHQRDQALELAEQLGARVRTGENRETARQQLLASVLPTPSAAPGAGVVQRDGLLQIGGVRLRTRR